MQSGIVPAYSVPLHKLLHVAFSGLGVSTRERERLPASKKERVSLCVAQEEKQEKEQAQQPRISTSDPTVTGRSPDSGQLDDRGWVRGGGLGGGVSQVNAALSAVGHYREV